MKAGSSDTVSEAIEYTIGLLRDINTRCPEVQKVCDIDAFILNELNPTLVAARKLEEGNV